MYSGSTELLTSPQILTHPYVFLIRLTTRHLSIDLIYDRSVNNGNEIFGEGSIEASVSNFENHACNEYRKWSGFGLEAFVKEVKNTDEVERLNEGKNRLMQRLGNVLGRRDCFIWCMSHCVTERRLAFHTE
jgi:hypothetical protein